MKEGITKPQKFNKYLNRYQGCREKRLNSDHKLFLELYKKLMITFRISGMAVDRLWWSMEKMCSFENNHH
jgi:hypothetical protein